MRISTFQSAKEAVRPLEVDVVIEIPRGSFVKRGSTGLVDFVSPLPCPYNYGSVPDFVGLEGDLLDALVLGPSLRAGTLLRVKAWGAVTLMDRGMSDDKLVCSAWPPSDAEKKNVVRTAAETARRPAEVEVYPTAHRWMVPDSQAYDVTQAERGWGRMREMFGRM